MKPAGLFGWVVFASAALGAQPDVAALVKRSVANHDRAVREQTQWRYKQIDTTHSGGEKHVETSEVIPLFGTPYERLIAKDGRPLSPEEQKIEERKYEKAFEKRQKESPAERAARIKKYHGQWSFLADLPAAYEFKLLGEEAVEGRPAWIIGMTPRAGFVPSTSRGSMLRHISGKLWLDKHDVQWAKAEAHVINMIEIGWVLARVGPGAEIRMDMTRVAEGLWMPASIDINGSAKVLMVHHKNLNEQLKFSDFARVGRDQAVQVTGNHPPKQVR
ncbi:MAG: hypothetical protein QOJ99_5206 [Bryobacterales bacterium]|jgi:hypothetical protein|nr:hypothetical protein [Bryobacterales bacterium]